MTRVERIIAADDRVNAARSHLTRLDVCNPRFQPALDDFQDAIRARQAAEHDPLPRTKLSRERRDDRRTV